MRVRCGRVLVKNVSIVRKSFGERSAVLHVGVEVAASQGRGVEVFYQAGAYLRSERAVCLLRVGVGALRRI